MVVFDHVYKAYDLHAGRKTIFGALKLVTSPSSAAGLFYALSDVSFQIGKGEAFGIIGRNGAGKSTVLKIIAGITKPTRGTVAVTGRISSLIELGAGFHPDLTGRENIFLSGAILGIPKKYIEQRFKEIVDFSELWDFIDVPVKKYSSGMYARLGFAVAISVDPEILIIDEILAVGDVFFQQKCFTKMREIIKGGTTFIYVTHDTAGMQNLCDRALLLDGGKVEFLGNATEAVSRYYGKMSMRPVGPSIREHGASIMDAVAHDRSYVRPSRDLDKIRQEIFSHNIIRDAKSSEGPIGMEILGASFQNEKQAYAYDVELMHTATIRVIVKARQLIPLANAGFTLFDRMNNVIFSAGIAQRGQGIHVMQPGEERVVIFCVQMAVKPGQYTFALGCSESTSDDLNHGSTHHRLFGLGPLEVYAQPEAVFPFHGMVSLPMTMSVLS